MLVQVSEASAGIGSGRYASAGTIEITSGRITATGGANGAGIGSGSASGTATTGASASAGTGNISISGGYVDATGGNNSAGIGGGNGSPGGTITISGGDIKATSKGGGASIGGGKGGLAGNISIQAGLFFQDNTGFTKVYDETDNSAGYIGNGSFVEIGDNVYADSEYKSNLIPAGSIASGELTLREIETFYSDDGKFLLDDPQTVTITQGDGKTASFTVYADDTLDGIAGKINDAISTGLGQSKYITDGIDSDRFAVYISDEEAFSRTSESVAGTMLIRSAVAGKNGTLRFSGSDEMLKNLGLNTIQKAKENEFTADITKAGTNEIFASFSGVTGGRIKSAINENIDVGFDDMLGVFADWNVYKSSGRSKRE